MQRTSGTKGGVGRAGRIEGGGRGGGELGFSLDREGTYLKGVGAVQVRRLRSLHVLHNHGPGRCGEVGGTWRGPALRVKGGSEGWGRAGAGGGGRNRMS